MGAPASLPVAESPGSVRPARAAQPISKAHPAPVPSQTHFPRPSTLPAQLNAGVEKYIKDLGFEQQTRWALNFRLVVLEKLDRCLGNRVHSAGTMSAWMRLAVNHEKHEATGSSVDPVDSELDASDDQRVYDCLREVHVGAVYPFENTQADPSFNVRLQVTFPIENDPIYRFLATGSW